MTRQEIINKYASDKYQFEQDIKKIFDKSISELDNKYEVFEPFCEKIDKKFLNLGQTAAYVRVLWGVDCENPADLADELLDVARRYDVIQYCVFYDDDDIIIVAVYSQK